MANVRKANRLIIETTALNHLSNGIKVLLIFATFFDEITTYILPYIIYVGDLNSIKSTKKGLITCIKPDLL